MRIVQRVAERGSELVRGVARKRVLLPLRFVVPLLGSHAGTVGEVPLPQPVGAEHAKRIRPALDGERKTGAVGAYKARVLEACEQPRSGSARNLKRARDALDRTRCSFVFGSVQLLERILDAIGKHSLVVMTAHRKGLVRDAVLGSTAEQVLRRVRVPVLTAPAV